MLSLHISEAVTLGIEPLHSPLGGKPWGGDVLWGNWITKLFIPCLLPPTVSLSIAQVDTASEKEMEDPEVHTYTHTHTLQASWAPNHLRSPREQEVKVWKNCSSVPMGWSSQLRGSHLCPWRHGGRGRWSFILPRVL